MLLFKLLAGVVLVSFSVLSFADYYAGNGIFIYNQSNKTLAVSYTPGSSSEIGGCHKKLQSVIRYCDTTRYKECDCNKEQHRPMGHFDMRISSPSTIKPITTGSQYFLAKYNIAAPGYSVKDYLDTGSYHLPWSTIAKAVKKPKLDIKINNFGTLTLKICFDKNRGWIYPVLSGWKSTGGSTFTPFNLLQGGLKVIAYLQAGSNALVICIRDSSSKSWISSNCSSKQIASNPPCSYPPNS